MIGNRGGLPNFSDPPVREVVLGVQFAPLPELGLFDVGSLLEELAHAAGGEWRRPDTRPPTGQMSLGAREWTAIAPQIRATMLRADKARQLQLENGWLTMNWIHQPNGEPYPRYEGLRKEFDPLLMQLAVLLEKRIGSHATAGSGEASLLCPNFWEFTYVNALPQKGSWSLTSGWHSWFPGLVGPLPHLPPHFSSTCMVQTIAAHESFDGRIEVVLEREDEFVPGEHRSKTGEKKANITVVRPSLSLRITVQGRVGPQITTWQEGMDAGHGAGVEVFASLLSEMAKEKFGYVEQ